MFAPSIHFHIAQQYGSGGAHAQLRVAHRAVGREQAGHAHAAAIVKYLIFIKNSESGDFGQFTGAQVAPAPA